MREVLRRLATPGARAYWPFVGIFQAIYNELKSGRVDREIDNYGISYTLGTKLLIHFPEYIALGVILGRCSSM